MRRFLTALLCLAAPAANASASFTYNVNLSAPNLSMGASNVTATGTITVDMLGDLSAGDITSYSIAISSSNSSTTLGPTNSTFSLQNATLVASGANLVINFSSNAVGQFGLSAPNINAGFQYQYLGQILAGSFTITNGMDSGVATIPSRIGNIVGTIVSASVPEPSSLVLIGTAGVIGLGAWDRKRRAA